MGATKLDDRFPKWWPVVAGFAVVIAAGAQVQAKVDTLEIRADKAETMSLELRDRLARIEEAQKNTLHSVRRIEAMLDERD